MQITMRSMVSGNHNTRDIPVTQAQLDAWQPGVLITRLPCLSFTVLS